MSKSQAATVVSALVTAGYLAQVGQRGGSYFVLATNPDGAAVAASIVNNFANSNGVTGQVYAAEFI